MLNLDTQIALVKIFVCLNKLVLMNNKILKSAKYRVHFNAGGYS